MVKVGHDSAVRPDDASQTLPEWIDGTQASAVGELGARARRTCPSRES